MQKTVDFCEDFLSINTNGFGRSRTGFGISNDFDRKFARKRPNTESFRSEICVLKLNTKSHFKGDQHLVKTKGKFNPNPPIKVRSMRTEGNCCWKIRTHYIK